MRQDALSTGRGACLVFPAASRHGGSPYASVTLHGAWPCYTVKQWISEIPVPSRAFLKNIYALIYTRIIFCVWFKIQSFFNLFCLAWMGAEDYRCVFLLDSISNSEALRDFFRRLKDFGSSPSAAPSRTDRVYLSKSMKRDF